MESIEKPQALKTIVVFIINVVLFVVYYYILSFCMGLLAGLVILLVGKDIDVVMASDSLVGILTILSLIITIVLAIVTRKHIFFRVKKTTDVVVNTAPSDTTTTQ